MSTPLLLLHHVRAFLAPEAAPLLRAPGAEQVDWPALLDLAAWHRVVPFLYWGLQHTCPEAVPPSAWTELEAQMRAALGHSLILTGELLRLLKDLHAQGIPAMPFKGPALAAALYGDVALRQCDDLDLLVHQEDFPRPDATAADLEQALTWAAAEAFVARLPHGVDTVVGERGIRLSGGERQRLALARALLRRTTFLILDEATSALDSASETLIQQALRALHGQTTMVIISHRLSTVREADTLYVLEEGRVVASGRWEELRVHERLHAFYRAQLAEPGLGKSREGTDAGSTSWRAG